MMMSSWRVGPRLPATVSGMTRRCTRVVDPCPRGHRRRGPVAGSEAGSGALPLPAAYPRVRPPSTRKTPPSRRGITPSGGRDTTARSEILRSIFPNVPGLARPAVPVPGAWVLLRSPWASLTCQKTMTARSVDRGPHARYCTMTSAGPVDCAGMGDLRAHADPGTPARLRPVLVAASLVAEGEDRCLDAVLQAEFGKDAADMGLDGLLADRQVAGDLPVAVTAGDQLEYVAFAR